MMSSLKKAWVMAILVIAQSNCSIALAQTGLPLAPAIAPPAPGGRANSVLVPKQILRTGINVNSKSISPNTIQLAEQLQIMPMLTRMQELRGRINSRNGSPTLESLSDRQEMMELSQKTQAILIRSSLEVDFVLSEISAEKNIYSEVMSSFQGSRDKLVARINAGSFILNGALWAVCEALDIPTAHYANYATASGTTGILAGIIPSIASGYALKAYSGKHKRSEVEPNMLAKIFDRPINEDIEYPKSVWTFLNTVPASENTSKTRRDQLIDRWISDKNIPSFTDKSSSKDIDVITATASQNKGLSIDNLNVRSVMLEQLHCEILKMKRLLMEIAMVVTSEKEV